MANVSQENRLYVAGVSWNTTDEGFKAFFSAFGIVKDAMVMRDPTGRSRGFGFVTYEDGSSVDAVMQQQRQLDGRRLDIKHAVSKDEMSSGSEPKGSTKKLYVAGLAFSCSDDDMFNFFAKFGEIDRVEIMKEKTTGRSRGFGFVTFTQEGGVTAAMAAQDQGPLSLCGRSLDIKPSLPRGSSGLVQSMQPANVGFGNTFNNFGRPMAQGFGRGVAAQPAAPRASKTKLYVAGLLFSTKEAVFKAYFEAFGTVTDVYISKNKDGESRGFGFVTFATEAEARDCAGKLHLIDGKRVDVKPATPKTETPPVTHNYMGGMGGYPMNGGYGYEDQFAAQQQQFNSYDSYGRGGGFEEDYHYNSRGGYGAYPSSGGSRRGGGYHPYSR